jgi:hypothetical protein
LLGRVKSALGDLVLELVDLGGSESSGIALVMRGAELLQSLVAEDAEPLADLAWGDPHQVSDLLPSPPVVDPEQHGEALIDPAILGSSPSVFDVFALLGS